MASLKDSLTRNEHFRFLLLVIFSFTSLILQSEASVLPEGFTNFPRLLSSLARRATFAGFQLVPTNSLKGLGLDPICEQVLYQNVSCDNFVLSLGQKIYHHGLNDSALTTAVCDATCGNSLSTFHRRVIGACAKTPEIMPGFPALALIDSIYTGYNETCLKDNATQSYCNGTKLSFQDRNNSDDDGFADMKARHYRLLGSRGRCYSNAKQPALLLLLWREA